MPFIPVVAAEQVLIADLPTLLQTALNSVQTNVQGMIGVAMPIGLGIMGTILAVRIGVRFFRGLVA